MRIFCLVLFQRAITLHALTAAAVVRFYLRFFQVKHNILQITANTVVQPKTMSFKFSWVCKTWNAELNIYMYTAYK